MPGGVGVGIAGVRILGGKADDLLRLGTKVPEGAVDDVIRAPTGSPETWSKDPKSIQDQMTLDAAKEGQGSKIIDNLGDEKFKGMENWEYKVKSENGRDSVVHYVRDPQPEN